RYINSSFGQLVFQQPGLSELYEQAAGVLTIYSPKSLTHLANIDPRAIAEGRKAMELAARALERRRRSGQLGWTSCVFPSEALAQGAGVDLTTYEELWLRANWLRAPEPPREWRRIKAELDTIAEGMTTLGAEALHVESDHMDLTVYPGENRRFVGFTGANVPSCEVFVSPDCRRTQGVFFADQSSIYQGRIVEAVKLFFDGGVAVRAEAARNNAFVQSQLFIDSGARRLGEFSLTDKRFSKITQFMAHTLLDENAASEHGNCHIALGSSIPDTFSGPPEMLTPELERALGFNASGIHWDLVNTEPKRVSALIPGEKKMTVYEDGEFLL
ncbi:MAG: aminopeptidase, partial [Proteobacteria bacterium]|nr:aminopeptidase [Pseudomonadota bacterium]